MNSTSGISAGTGYADVSVTHYIPLRFWFNRNPGLALPLIALQYHEVKVNVTLGAETELMGKLKTADTDESLICW